MTSSCFYESTKKNAIVDDTASFQYVLFLVYSSLIPHQNNGFDEVIKNSLNKVACICTQTPFWYQVQEKEDEKYVMNLNSRAKAIR